MATKMADEYADIAQRMREIAAEKQHARAMPDDGPVVGWCIWYDAQEREPGWIYVKSANNWGVTRKGDATDPTFFPSEGAAALTIATKQSSKFDVTRMRPRPYDPDA